MIAWIVEEFYRQYDITRVVSTRQLFCVIILFTDHYDVTRLTNALCLMLFYLRLRVVTSLDQSSFGYSVCRLLKNMTCLIFRFNIIP